MTPQEKILNLEIENARLKMALEELEIPYLAFTPKEMPRFPEVIIRAALTATASTCNNIENLYGRLNGTPSEVMEKLKRIKEIVFPNSCPNAHVGCSRCEILAILKELGV